MNLDEWYKLGVVIGGFSIGGAVTGTGIAMLIDKVRARRKKKLDPFEDIIMDFDDEKPKGTKPYKFDPVSRTEILGIEPIVQRVDRYKEILANHQKYQDQIDLPMGVVLNGPPGVGKTYLARYFFTGFQGDVLELARGDMTSFNHIREAYAQARKRRDSGNKPVILFRDEIGIDVGGKDSYQLLEELSGVNSSQNRGIFFVGTTNQSRDDDGSHRMAYMEAFLDESSPLYRPGRLEVIKVGPPNLESKARIFALYLGKPGVTYSDDPSEIATMVPFFQTGAFIKQICQETVLNKSNNGQAEAVVTNADLLQTLNTLTLGTKQEGILTDEQRLRVATHEVGHYLVARELGYKVAFVSVEHHANTLGYAHLCPNQDEVLATDKDLANRIKIFLGGILAEQEMRGSASIGCLEDLRMVHQIYRYLHALQNHAIDPVYLFHTHPQVRDFPRLDIPHEEMKKFEDAVHGVINREKRGIPRLAEYVAKEGTVHSSELEKQLTAA
jgi:cell division protease FtsH